MRLQITDYQAKTLKANGDHLYLKAIATFGGVKKRVEIFFRDRLEEKKIFENAEILLNGELVEADGGSSIVNAEIISVKLKTELPLENLSIKDRLNASGLIHEFREVYRRDKIRAREILKVVGVSEEYAEEILLRNSYILPFI